ncbi:MAG: aminoacetone oxidase family FAD-binding enzyme [Sphaerochaeta sp.]|nr:aminoacetone oxidase family FAD-binding enzyme [Sphaerochaeta sp.]
MYGLIIIGGGAGGLFASANLPTRNALLLEHTAEVGKKILITGGGMCNITNTLGVDEFLTHFGSKEQRNFLLPALQTLSPTALASWFEERGCELVVREDGKVFPKSLDAHHVRDLLVRESRATIMRETKVEHIQRTSDDTFLVTTNRETYEARNLLLATGGMSYPRTGSDGSGYQLAKALGHTIVPPRSGLAALSIEDYSYRHLAGNALRSVQVEFYHKGESKRYAQACGDVLFTHDGLSGPVILTASRSIRKGDRIAATLLSCKTKANLEKEMHALLLAQPKKQVSSLLREAGLFSALAQFLLSSLSLKAETKAGELSKQNRLQLVRLITDHPFTVSSVKGFQSAMVTAGGVNLSEVDRKRMESTLQKGLFFCGEVLDYDGESGGFNLQAAFSTAYLAVQHVSR